MEPQYPPSTLVLEEEESNDWCRHRAEAKGGNWGSQGVDKPAPVLRHINFGDFRHCDLTHVLCFIFVL